MIFGARTVAAIDANSGPPRPFTMRFRRELATLERSALGGNADLSLLGRGLHAFGDRREGVVGDRELVHGDAETQSDRESLDDIAGAWRDDMQPQHAAARAVEDDLEDPELPGLDAGRLEVQLFDIGPAP